MARAHEPTAALAWMGFVVIAAPRLTIPQVAAGLVVAAGAGILPDLDHPKAAPAHSLGWPTMKLAEAINWVAQKTATSDANSQQPGHRQITHCLLACAGITLASRAIAGAADHRWLVGMIAVCTLFCLRVLGPKRTRRSILKTAALTGLVTWLVWRYVPAGPWEWQAVTIGYTAHIAADCLSAGGVPLLWPLRWRFGIAVVVPWWNRQTHRWRRKKLALVPVNSGREHWLARGCYVAIAVLMYGLVAR